MNSGPDNHDRVGHNRVGIVLSGGGARAAYQVGVLKALAESGSLCTNDIAVVVGTSIGAINGIILSGCLGSGIETSLSLLWDTWAHRNYRNTFRDHASVTFINALKVAFMRYTSPGPVTTSLSIFNPVPLQSYIDQILGDHKYLDAKHLIAVGVMTTVDGEKRSPLLLARTRHKLPPDALIGANFEVCYLKELTAFHGLASAALPSVLPPVKLDLESRSVRLVDGGICDNHPVDPAVRLGADKIIIIDCSGRRWWFDHYGQPHYTKPNWQVDARGDSFCMLPHALYDFKNELGLGKVLEESIGKSTRHYISALGPTWPIFKALKHRMGHSLALEVMSYIALHPDYHQATLSYGYQQAKALLSKTPIPWSQPDTANQEK